MPVYEFQCEDCGERFSELRKIGDFVPGKCGRCGSSKVRKVMSGFSSAGSSTGPSCAPSGGG